MYDKGVVCQPGCPKNSHFTDCGTPCPLTCENYNKQPQPCAFVCMKGCRCKEGFVLYKNGMCVRPSECP
ncbi:hypothetical protein M0802_008978 [Mischocyttarus mexicanus]|nr:hypothetical protein M0802_008978 [Mischocyttarus mexicanus]